MNDQFKELLYKLPLIPLLLAWGAYLGYGYYDFTTDPGSPLIQEQQQIQSMNQQLATNRTKLAKAQEFYRTLQSRRENLRKLALQLEQVKATLSDQIDLGSFIRMVVGEADKVGLTVLGIKPTGQKEHQYYVEQSFQLKFRGVYAQVEVFLDRLAGLERIIRIGDFAAKPISSADSEYVQLQGQIQLNTYRYRGSKADDLGKDGGSQ